VLQSAVTSAERVLQLLDEPEEVPQSVAPALFEAPVGAVALEDVSFRYEPPEPLIDDLSLDVAAGQTVAIVGPTGAGKTTLVNLLMRFYELDGGRITIDGVDTREMKRDDLRKAIGMVLQDYVAIPRHDPREHRLRPAGGYGGRDPSCGRGGARRPLRAHAAGWLRDGDR